MYNAERYHKKAMNSQHMLRYLRELRHICKSIHNWCSECNTSHVAKLEFGF